MWCVMTAGDMAGQSFRRIRSFPKTICTRSCEKCTWITQSLLATLREAVWPWILLWASGNDRSIVFDRAGGARHGQLGLLQRARQPEQCAVGSWRSAGDSKKLVQGPFPDRG